jgi:nicotinamide mononucleotide transporter pnuC
MSHISDWIFSQYKDVPNHLIYIEILGVFFGLVSVIFSKKRNIWVYPTGIISTVLFVYLLWCGRLFGDMLINAYYTIMSVYGWVLWAKNSKDNIHVEISKMNAYDIKITSWLALMSWLLVMIVYYFKPYINNNFSLDGIELGIEHFVWTDWVDATTTAIFLVGMWLMAKRKIENWIFWIIGDVVSIPLYTYKNFIFTALQYAIFTIIAISAYREWKRILRN